jgi:hypothetical protein
MGLLVRESKVPNEALANHPTIITEVVDPYPPTLTILGLLQGIMAIDGEKIEAEWDTDYWTLKGFRLRSEEEKERLEMARSEA